jgi:hypothetical protein
MRAAVTSDSIVCSWIGTDAQERAAALQEMGLAISH